MRKLYTTKLINRPEMKFYHVLDYTLPGTWPKSTQAEIQNEMIDIKFYFSPTYTSNHFFWTRNKNGWPENTDPRSVDPPTDPVHGLPYGPLLRTPPTDNP